MIKRLSVVICTSNNYIEFVEIFLYFFNNFFKKQQEYDIFVVGVTKGFDIKKAKCLPSSLSSDAPWSSRVIDGLLKINSKNILFLTEDILFKKSSFDIEFLLDIFEKEDMDYLRLSPFPAPTKKINDIYGEVNPFIIHRISMQPSLWKYEFLMHIIKKNESIWEFEINGSRRSRISNKIMALNRYFIDYEEIISRGQITRAGHKLLLQNNFNNLNFKQNTVKQELIRNFYHFATLVLSKISFIRKYSGI